MRHKRILTLILAMIMVFQFIPADIYAIGRIYTNNGAAGDPGSEIKITVIEKPYPVEYIPPVTAYSKSNSYVKFPMLQGSGERIFGSAVLVGGGFPVKLTLDKSTGNVMIPFKQLMKNGAWNAPGIMDLKIEVTYVEPKIPPNPEPKPEPTPKPIEITKVNLEETMANIAPSTGTESKEQSTEIFGLVSPHQKDLAVTLYEYFSQAEAIPDIGTRYRDTVKTFDEIRNDSFIFTEADIAKLYSDILAKNPTDENGKPNNPEYLAAVNTMLAVQLSFDSEYADKNPLHPALYQGYERAINYMDSMLEGKPFRHKPFIYAFNSLRTALLFSDKDLGREALNARNMGNNVNDTAAFNPLFDRDSDAGGDYSTRKFGKDPMETKYFQNILRNNNLLTDSWQEWRTLGQHELSEEENKDIINSAIRGIEVMGTGKNKSGTPRTWTVEKTFNYLRTDSYDPNNDLEAKELTSQKIQGWKDSLVILQFPSKYTWGSGLLYNLTGFYAEVPLAPTIGEIDLEIDEYVTEWIPEVGAYSTVFQYKTDLMPTIPETMAEFQPQLIINVVKGEILGTVIDNEIKTYVAGVTELTTPGYLKDKNTTNSFTVLWRPNVDSKPDEKALLYASVNMITDSYAQELRSVLTGEAKQAIEEIIAETHVQELKSEDPAHTTGFYRHLYKESNYDKNLISITRTLPPMDLYVRDPETRYDKLTNELVVKGVVGVDGARELEKLKGELPVEVLLTWSTEDGRSGQEKLEFDTFKSGTNQDFEFKVPIALHTDDTLDGKFEVRVNPEPINPYEPDLINNSFNGVISAGKEVDFAIDPINELVRSTVGDGNIDLKFVAMLFNEGNSVNTSVDLYKNGSKVVSQNVTFLGGEPKVITFSLTEAAVGVGTSTYEAVVNANYNLTSASPYTAEKDLTNNKAKSQIELSNAPVSPTGPCTFNGTHDLRTYSNRIRVAPFTKEVWESDWVPGYTDHKGNYYPGYDNGGWVTVPDYNYECTPPIPYSLKRTSEMVYLEQSTDKYGIFSNQWHKHKAGQDFGSKFGLPDGKDLDGLPAYDAMMAAVGHPTLKQVIQAGAGIEVKAKIRITGTLEEFDGYADHTLVHDYIKSFKEGAVFVNGDKVRNNNGDYRQTMVYDSERSPELVEIIQDIGDRTLGNHPDCEQQFVYTTTYEIEIPVIITKATGTIDVVGGEKVPVPDEAKWFVYLNELDGKDSKLTVVSQMNSSLLEASSGIVNCDLNHNEFRFGIYGTIFDNVNVTNPGDDDDGFWDN